MDNGKALADYASLETNSFWQLFLDEFGEKINQELKVLATTDELPDIYKSQGKIAAWSSAIRLPGELVAKLRR